MTADRKEYFRQMDEALVKANVMPLATYLNRWPPTWWMP